MAGQLELLEVAMLVRQAHHQEQVAEHPQGLAQEEVKQRGWGQHPPMDQLPLPCGAYWPGAPAL